MQKRIDYIDYIKGFAVLWIVWIHTEHPDFVSVPVRNTLFFFVSGIFFKDYPLNVFLKKKLQGLIVPLVFFYLVSYFYRIGLHYWDYKDISTFNYLCIFDVFRWESCSDYLFVNVPLWFLLSLFNMQLLLLGVMKVSSQSKKSQLTFISLVVLILFVAVVLEAYPIPLPFMLNKTFNFFIYYLLGYLLGKKLIEFIDNKKTAFFTFLISLSLFCIICFSTLQQNVSHDIYMFFTSITFLPIIFVLFQRLSSLKVFKPFAFFGKNSLVVLCAHVPIQIIIRRIFFKYWGATILTGIIDTLLTILILYFVILLMNKYLPQFVGKKSIEWIDRSVDRVFDHQRNTKQHASPPHP